MTSSVDGLYQKSLSFKLKFDALKGPSAVRTRAGTTAEMDAMPVVPRLSSGNARKSKFSWSNLKEKAQRDPLVFGFLALTVAALVRGLGAMTANDKRGSQRMMRFRVGFQLAALTALVGGVYYRGITAPLPTSSSASGVPAKEESSVATPATSYPALSNLFKSWMPVPPAPRAPSGEEKTPLR